MLRILQKYLWIAKRERGGERKGWNEGHHLAEGTFDEGLVADIGYKSFNALCRVN